MADKRIDPLATFETQRHGSIIVIMGKVRVGKSYLANQFSRVLLNRGRGLITNTKLKMGQLKDYKYRDSIWKVRDDIGLFEAYSQCYKDSVLVWDDAQTIAGGKSMDVMKKEGDKVTDLMLYFGKLQMSMVYVSHLEYVPASITQQQPIWIYKLDKYHFYFSGHQRLWGDREIREKAVKVRVPDIKPLPYETFGFSSFGWHLDLKALWYELSEVPEYKLRETVKKYIARAKETQGHGNLTRMTYSDIVTALWLKARSKGKELDTDEPLYKVINREALYGTINNLERVYKVKK